MGFELKLSVEAHGFGCVMDRKRNKNARDAVRTWK